MKEFKGLKEAASATKRATGIYGNNHFQISLDTATDTIICDEHVSRDSYIEYNSTNIIHICHISSPCTEDQIIEKVNDVYEY